jgi:type II secretory pathway pseudopilin PulG
MSRSFFHSISTSPGVTLVEVLVSLVLASIVCLGIAMSYTQNIRENVRTRRIVEAESALKTAYAIISNTPAALLPPVNSAAYTNPTGAVSNQPSLTPIPGPTIVVQIGARSYRVEPSYSKVVSSLSAANTNAQVSSTIRRITMKVRTSSGEEVLNRDVVMNAPYYVTAPVATPTPG